ncbi:N/A [soil metagenome]
MATVWIPVTLRSLSGGLETVELEGRNLRQLIVALDNQFPGIKARLCEGDALRPGIAASVDGQIANLGLLQPVAANSEVHFVLAVAGG